MDCAFRATVGPALGLLCGTLIVMTLPALPEPAVIALAALGAMLLSACAARQLALAATLLGVAITASCARSAMDLRIPPSWEGQDIEVSGRIVDLPEPIERGWRIELEADTLALGGRALSGPRLLRLAWYETDRDAAPVSGTHIRASARLRRPRGTQNPGGFDFEAWALQQRIAAVGYVRQVHELAPPERAGIDTLRQRLSGRIGARVEAPATAALLQALAIGDQGRLDDAQWQVLRTTGTTHLVAISGFHIGAVAWFAALAAALVWRLVPALGLRCVRSRAAVAAGLLAATGYSVLAGLSVPVLRTLAMMATLAAARMFARAASTPQMLALALIVALLVDPLAVLGAGFWLSFAGVAWLVWCFHGRDQMHPGRAFLRAQLAASLGLAPFTLLFFQQVSVLGTFANLIAVPVVTLVLVPMLLLSLMLGLDASPVGAALLELAATLTEYGWQGLEYAATWPLAEWRHASASILVFALALAGVACVLAPRGLRAGGLGCALLLPLIWPLHQRLGTAEFELTVFDVGQGQSVLIRTRSHSALVDAGPAPAGRLDLGEQAVVPALRAFGMRRLDLAIVTHRDNDHAGGMAAVVRALPVLTTLRADAADGPGRCSAGRRWVWDEVTFEILHPPPHFPYLGNETSCVLRVHSRHGSALLPGDIGTLIEARLMQGNTKLNSDVLLVPHHGSASSSSAAFVAATAPTYALVSAGWRNRFGHPHAAVLERYRRQGASIISTAATGAISVRFEANTVAPKLASQRGQRRRLWHEAAESVP